MSEQSLAKNDEKKKPDEPYEEFLAFLEKGKVSLFNGKHHQVLVSLDWTRRKYILSYMPSTHTVVQNFIRATVRDSCRLDSIHLQNMPGIQSISNTKPKHIEMYRRTF